jgi:Protein of unknown function (DUF2793)
MPDNLSARHQFPFLGTGQAQKEITHNEALVLIDALLHPSVQSELPAPPAVIAEADNGKTWLIGTGASGAWAGKAGQIAHWTGGSWRYLAPQNGMRIWNIAFQVESHYINGQWAIMPAIAAPNGGTVIDIEARNAIASILQMLRTSGVIAV